MSSLSTTTLFSQNYLPLHFHSRKLLLHIPLHQSKPEANPPAATNHHDPLDPYSGASSFDANIIIVLSLLVCGLICSIGVNFIIRCTLRCISSPPTVSENPSSQIPNTGIEKKVLKSLTTLKYSEGLTLPGLDYECVICLSQFKPGERVRVLPKCNHGFHVQCIDKWLSLHRSCPMCRNSLVGTCQKIVNCSQGDSPAPTPETRETVLSITPLEPEGLVCN